MKVKKALMAPNISTSKAMDVNTVREDSDDVLPPSTDDGGGKAPTTADPPSMAVQENSRPLDTKLKGQPVPEKVVEAMQVLRQVQTHIEKTFDHVGKQFAEEARKIHYGETEKRSIYGEATSDEAEELAEEGIEINRMPWLTTRNS